MTIKSSKDGFLYEIAVEGRLDTTTSPMLETELLDNIADVKELILNFDGLEYISSAGLRVVLMAQKRMNSQGKMTVKNVCEEVKGIFDITGFSEILTIE